MAASPIDDLAKFCSDTYKHVVNACDTAKQLSVEIVAVDKLTLIVKKNS